MDRLLLPMSFAEFARCAGYALPEPPRISFDAFYTEDGRTACQDALVQVERWTSSSSPARAAESKYVDTPSTREARAMVANFGGGLLLTRGAIDLRPGVTIIPAALFSWLLDQRC